MTLDDLFAQLAEKGGTFVVLDDGAIRETRTRCCPLEWLADVRAFSADEAIVALDLDIAIASKLIDAADNRYPTRAIRAIRARLLALYGLTERQG